MTRYRSSPTCSKCWAIGHTKRACPEYRKKAATWLKENEHLKDTEGYYKHMRIAQRIGSVRGAVRKATISAVAPFARVRLQRMLRRTKSGER